MKVVVVIVAAIMLASAHAADIKCEKLCSGGASSCQTKGEAAGCRDTYRLNAMNACVQCGTTPIVAGGKKDSQNSAIGAAAGGGFWWKPWNSGTCSTCTANCDACATETTCQTCKHGYRQSGGKCEQCTQANCKNCDDAVGTCKVCNAGFGVKGGACVQCTANCNSCNGAAPLCDVGSCATNYVRYTGGVNTGTCFSCVTKKEVATSCPKGTNWVAIANQGLFVDAAAGTCKSCVANCANCATATTCTACKSGFGLKDAKNDACHTCAVSGCGQCNLDANKCNACATGLPSADKTKCTVCTAPNHWDNTGSGTCSTCAVTHCKQCLAGGATCGTCDDGYIIDATTKKTCHKCIANCKTCTEAQSTKAGNAAANQKCSGTNVATNSCMAGYFPDQTVGKANLQCVKCADNCSVCANQYSCQTCATGFQIGAGKCTACKGTTCAAGVTAATTYHNTRWESEQARSCIDCMANCNIGTATRHAVTGACICKNCAGGYWPFDNKGVHRTNVNDQPTGSCQSCGANCNLCFSKDQCKANSCKAGFSNNNANGACLPCSVTNCVACAANKDVCTLCSGTMRVGNAGKTCYQCPAAPFHENVAAATCTSCPAGCAQCNTDATKCNGCAAGYVQDTTDATKCHACMSNCAKCTFATKATACDNCAAGYLTSQKKTCFKCSGVGQFANVATGTCNSCTANCVSCASATTCNNGGCAEGYVENGGTCHQCTISNCKSCQFITRTTKCDSCKGKYAIQSNKAGSTTLNNCDAMCDNHATSCGDAYGAASCDTAKNYYKVGSRCVYCNLKMTAGGTAAAGKATTAGNQFLTAGGVCATCDPDADGCKGPSAAAKCKTATNSLTTGGNCVAKCSSTQKDIGYLGKCNSGCVSNVAETGTVDGGALDNALGGCYLMDGREAQLCNKGYHVQGAGVGRCCDDDNAASGLVAGSAVFASVLTAFYALM